MTKRKQDDCASNHAFKRLKSDFDETITLLVNDQHAIVHKDLICSQSDLMRAACSGAWTESKEGVVRLTLPQGCTINHVKTYLARLYSRYGDLREFAEASQDEDIMTWQPEHLDFSRDLPIEIRQRLRLTQCLVTLWILGDYLQDAHFKDSVMGSLVRHTGRRQSSSLWTTIVPSTILQAWNLTAERSALHRWLINTMYPSFREIDIERCHVLGCDLPVDLLLELFKKSLREKERGTKLRQSAMVKGCKHREDLPRGRQCY